MSLARDEREEIRNEIKGAFVDLWSEMVKPGFDELRALEDRHTEILQNRITAETGLIRQEIGSVREEFAGHVAASCPGEQAHPAAPRADLEDHVKRQHDPVRQWGLVASIMAAGHGLVWLAKSLRWLGQ